MPNKHHLLIVFNKLIRLGHSKASGYNISANGSDIESGCIAGSGTRFIKLLPHSVDLVVDKTLNKAFLADKNRKYVINQDDVDTIKEVETDRIIWMSPKARQMIIELDPAARTKPKLIPITNGGPMVLFLDKKNCIPRSWTDGLDLKNFPLFVKMHAGIMFKEKDAKWLELEFIGDICPIEKFYVCQVYEKNGGKVLWRK
jgi:hypothetical protein